MASPHRTFRGTPDAPQDDQVGPTVIRRRCPVCDWQDEVIDKGEVEYGCPQCHAPTEAVPLRPAGKNPHAAALGRLGGLRGGKARAEALSPKRRREIARKAALARWGRRK